MATARDIDARKFARVAKQRLEEAKAIQRAQMPAAAEYLGGYAVECILKALVLTNTTVSSRGGSGEPTIEWLKKRFGHDLYRLRKECGARMPPEVAREFLFVSTWDPELRYEPGPGDPERAERFLNAARVIFEWAQRGL